MSEQIAPTVPTVAPVQNQSGVSAPVQQIQTAPVTVTPPAVPEAKQAMPPEVAIKKPDTLPKGEDPVPENAEAMLKKIMAELSQVNLEREKLAGVIPELEKNLKAIQEKMTAAERAKETAAIVEELRKIPGINLDLVNAEMVEKGIFPVEAGRIVIEALQSKRGFFVPGSATYHGQPINAAPVKMDANYWLKKDYGINTNPVQNGGN